MIITFEPTVEGDATSLFISRLLNPVDIKVTKLARDLAMDSDFAGTDSLTLAKAIKKSRSDLETQKRGDESSR